jgi:hypothetical protein
MENQLIPDDNIWHLVDFGFLHRQNDIPSWKNTTPPFLNPHLAENFRQV